MTRPTNPEAPRGKPWGKRLLLLVAALPLGVVCAELGLRGWLLARGEPWSEAAARDDVLAVLSPMRDQVPIDPAMLTEEEREQREAAARAPNQERSVLHPFFAFESANAGQGLEAEIDRALAGEFDGSCNVLIVGGSVAGIFGKRGVGVLRERLEASGATRGRPLHFFAQGRGSYKQPQQLHLVQSLFAAGVRLDLVLNIDGFNELALSSHNVWSDAHPLYPSVFKWGALAYVPDRTPETLDRTLAVWSARRAAEAWGGELLEGWRLRSALFGRPALGRLHQLRNRWVSAQEAFGSALLEARDDPQAQQVVSGPPFEGGLGAMLPVVARCWVESSISLDALCRARGVAYVHVLQPTLHDEGAKPVHPLEEARSNAHKAWIQAVVPGYPLLRERGAALLAAGVNFHDASLVFAGHEDPLYFDACHFNARGNELLAEAIAPTVIAALRARE